MPGSKSNYLESAILNHILGAETYTPASICYVALSSALYSDSATGASFSEITTGSAARVAATNNTTTWPHTSSNTKTNGTTLTFPTASGAWPEALSFYILDASSSGNILYGGDLTTPRTLLTGDTASFGPGSLVITED